MLALVVAASCGFYAGRVYQHVMEYRQRERVPVSSGKVVKLVKSS